MFFSIFLNEIWHAGFWNQEALLPLNALNIPDKKVFEKKKTHGFSIFLLHFPVVYEKNIAKKKV